ncbi:MAG TPA: hypothetical protein VIG99_15475 [Myxococcaceae bacterium]|jgi:hypothetical protein
MLAFLTVLANLSLADAPPPPDALPGPQSSGDRRVGPFTRDTYPSETSARPLTLPAGMVRGGAALDVEWIRLSTFNWSTNLGLSAAFGLTDAIEVNAFAAFGLSPLLEARRVGVSGALSLRDGDVLDLALAVGFDLAPSSTTSRPALSLALPGRLLFADQLFLTFGGELLRFQLSPLLPQAALKLGVGGQVTSSLAVVLETDVLKLAGGAALFHTVTLPLDLSVTLAVARGFDLRARVMTVNAANPRLAGTFTLAGSAYY